MESLGTFPFEQPVLDLVQSDRTPKKAFILGVYASAVHARWINPAGKTVVHALAVASEPNIFWRGDNPEASFQNIIVPEALGILIPARPEFNGPSGLALDNLILKPLDFDRHEVWLCDLVPHSCVNPSQGKAIERAYLPVATRYGLPEPSVPRLPNPLTDDTRRNQIFNEIIESGAGTLILLGDLPVRWFLSYFDQNWSRLSDFGQDHHTYGRLHDIRLGNRDIKVLPIAHPRQIARLGQSSAFWHEIHATWIEQSASQVAQTIKMV